MIIRRRHTANFTTIGNVLFEDERMALDEVGLMSWLLSRPNDWEVRRPALMKRFKVGRDGLRRILRNLLRFGWIVARVTRLSNGTVHVLYEVRDEPGPELSEDEARAALSLVSSGVGSGESEGDDGSDDGTEDEAEGADPPAGGGLPPTGQPEAASRLRQSPPGPIEESLKPDSENTESPKGVRAFWDVKAKWPTDHVLSEVVCESLHAGLTDKDKEATFQGVDPYLSDCQVQNRKVCDLSTFYRERRWERFAAKASAPSPHPCKRGTPQSYRWREYFERAEPNKLVMFDKLMSERGVYTTPSEWPPPLPPKAEAAAASGDSLSSDDKAFAKDGL